MNPARAEKGFVWPEPLVIDVVAERYVSLLEPSSIPRIARLHALLLRHIFENDVELAAQMRRLLVSECEGLGVAASSIAAVDRCAFWEIAALVNRQCRPTSLASGPIAVTLHAAVCRLGLIGLPPESKAALKLHVRDRSVTANLGATWIAAA